MSIVEVFADISCPFTHVALRHLVEFRATIGRPDVRFVVRAWPLELVNGQPLDGEFVADEIVDLQEQVAPDLFGGFRAECFPVTTLPALRLTHAAYGVGIDTGEEVALALRDHLFERGHDVADADVLADIARTHHVTWANSAQHSEPDPVEVDWAEGQARGVKGSPHFLGPGVDSFCPTLEIERQGEHLRIAFDASRFEAFTRACFA